jgi:hypothetical protein
VPLVAMTELIDALAEPFLVLDPPGVVSGGVTVSTVILIPGLGFPGYSPVSEIRHLLALDDPETAGDATPRPAWRVIVDIIRTGDRRTFAAMRARQRAAPRPAA